MNHRLRLMPPAGSSGTRGRAILARVYARARRSCPATRPGRTLLLTQSSHRLVESIEARRRAGAPGTVPRARHHLPVPLHFERPRGAIEAMAVVTLPTPGAEGLGQRPEPLPLVEGRPGFDDRRSRAAQARARQSDGLAVTDDPADPVPTLSRVAERRPHDCDPPRPTPKSSGPPQPGPLQPIVQTPEKPSILNTRRGFTLET